MATVRDPRADFWKLLVGQSVSSLGSSFTLFALPLLVFKLTNSAFHLALITIAEYLPFLFFGLIIGVWVDRVDRKRMMISADIAQAVILCSVPTLSALGLLSVWWVYVVAFTSSTLSICFNTAEFAAVPSLAQSVDLVAANGRLQASYSAATVAGPLLAGLLLAFVPVEALLLFDALSFLTSALAVSLIKLRLDTVNAGHNSPKGIIKEVTEGLSFILRHPVLRNTCCLMALVNGVGFTVYAQLVLYAKERLGASDTQVALLYAAGSVGMVVLALGAGLLRSRLTFSKAVLGAPMLGGILIVLLALTRWYWTATVLWASIWGLVVFFDITTNTLLQTVVPKRLSGRVRSAVSVLSWSSIPAGTFVGSLAIERTQNVALVYGAIGTTIIAAVLAFSFTSLGRAYDQLPSGKS
jgi:MFS family permease